MKVVDEYDFVIVGSGFGGAVSALRLAEKGYKVAVLEAGKRLQPQDFPKTNWDLRRFLWLPRLSCYGIQRMTLLRDVLVVSGAGVGGGSLVYANTLPVPRSEVFQHPEWPRGQDWQKALAPHYATAKRMLGATTNLRLSRADEVLKECAQEIGKGDTFRPTEVAVFFGQPGQTVPDPYFDGQGPERAGCIFCGGCMVGCRHNAKNTLDKNYLYLAEKLGADIYPETHADQIVGLDGGGYAVRSFRSTSLFKQGRTQWRAPNVVLAAGVLGTVNLLLHARERGWLSELSPALGRRVRTNSEAIVGATSRRKEADFTEGIAITSSIDPDEVTHIQPVRYPRGSDLIGLLAKPLTDGGPGLPRQLRFLLNCAARPSDLLRSLIPVGWAQKTIVLLVMQVTNNELRLARKRRWFWPFWRSLSSAPSEAGEMRNPSYIPIANDMARRVAKKIDGWPASAINEVLLNIPTTAHILGGASIGSDRQNAVCDGWNRVFGYPGLYVIDGSSIPVNLGVNPALTITALAEHAMSHIPVRREAMGTDRPNSRSGRDPQRLGQHKLESVSTARPAVATGKSILIVNPASAAGRTGRRWGAIAELARASGLEFEAVLTARPGDATEIARRAVRESRPLVVAVGGDGTLFEVVNGFFDGAQPIPTSSTLGLVQVGTGGDTRRTLGIPIDVEAAIRVLTEGRPRLIDVGRVTVGSRPHYFVNVAEAGIGADVSERANRMPKFLGSSTYFVATLASLAGWRHKPLRVSVDGRIHRELIGQAVVVANCQYYGGGMRIAPRAVPDDGVFDVIVEGPIGKVEAILNARKLYSGTHFEDPGLRRKLELLHGARVEVSSPNTVLVQLDGEVVGHLPATFEVVPRALRFMVPNI